MSIVLDLLVVVMGCGTVIIAARKGFVEMLVRFLGFFLAFVVASAVSPPVSEAVYTHWVEPQAQIELRKAIDEHGAAAATSAADALEQVVSGLPNYLTGSLDMAQTRQALDDLRGQNTAGLADGITRTIIRPAVTAFLRSAIFILLLGITLFLARFLSRFLRGVRRIPIVGQINRVLGGALGVLEAVMLLYVLAIAAGLYILISGNASPVLNEQMVHSSYLFRIFYQYNPFTLH